MTSASRFEQELPDLLAQSQATLLDNGRRQGSSIEP